MMQEFSVSDLNAAHKAGAIGKDDLAKLIDFLNNRTGNSFQTRFDLSNLLWYGGALVVIGAMGLFSTKAFGQMGGKALVWTASVYAIIFILSGHFLWHKKGLPIPGGLLITIAVSMAPMAVFGIQDMLGYWDMKDSYRDFHLWVRSSFLPMEIATILAAVLALIFYPFPFIVFIASFALWYMSMDITGYLFPDNMWEHRKAVSVDFGLMMLLIAWGVDLKRYKNGDFAFWLHLFGLAAFWGGLSSKNSDSELAKAIYCAINVFMLMMALFLQRKAYAVFGTMGVIIYLGDLADRVFKDSLLFPFVLSLIGVSVIAVGLLYYRNRDKLSRWLERFVPEALKILRPAHTRIST